MVLPYLFLGLIAMVFVAASVPALADIYDAAWINQCIEDNLDQGQTTETIRTYCECMNELMLTSELRSVTTWEKTHPEELEHCADKAGWIGR